MIKKKNIGLYIFLNIITLGIYGLFFWGKWTKDVNAICDGDNKDSARYALVFLLDICSLGIYTLVWNYQMAERLYQKAADYGVELKHGGMFVTIWKFIPFVSSIYKISYANKLIAGYNAKLTANTETSEVAE